MERINLDLKTEEFARRFNMVSFVEKSRLENPNPQVLEKRRRQLEASPRFTPSDVERRSTIDEVIVRLSAAVESGVSTHEVFELIESDKKHDFNRAEIQHEIWSLIDTGILVFTGDRTLRLSNELSLK